MARLETALERIKFFSPKSELHIILLDYVF